MENPMTDYQRTVFATALPQIIAERLLTDEQLRAAAERLNTAAGYDADYSYDSETRTVIKTTVHNGYGNSVDVRKRPALRAGAWAVWNSSAPDSPLYVAAEGTTEEFTAAMVPESFLKLDIVALPGGE